MKCIVCDCCKQIIENPRNCRVITCAKPLKPHFVDSGVTSGGRPVQYRGNDRQQNDILWEKEICLDCLDALEEFFETGVAQVAPTEPDQPEQPDNLGDKEQTTDPDDGNEGDEGGGTGEFGETGGEGESTQWL